MAKRKGATPRKSNKKRPAAKRVTKRASAKRSVKRPKAKSTAKRTAPTKKTRKPARRAAAPKRAAAKAGPAKVPRLDRARRTLEESVPTPPSSLNMNRHGSAARTGRAEIAGHRRNEGAMAAVTAGDVDVDAEDAYFTGEEAPGGDNPTPDQDIVDDIGKALGVQYDDNEELKGAKKLEERDKHRWELDPASSEDYKDRD